MYNRYYTVVLRYVFLVISKVQYNLGNGSFYFSSLFLLLHIIHLSYLCSLLIRIKSVWISLIFPLAIRDLSQEMQVLSELNNQLINMYSLGN